jgi:hypothetical protein
LLVGTTQGKILKYEDESLHNDWTNVKDPELLTDAIQLPVTSIVVHPDNLTKFFASVGGNDEIFRIWTNDTNTGDWSVLGSGLIDVHFNTMAINPKNPQQLFAGSDVGVWTLDLDKKDKKWETFSFGLPEVAVIDLKIFFRKGDSDKNVDEVLLLRASTHGRGVFECNLSERETPKVKLYLRGHLLDRGRNRISLEKKDPRIAVTKTTPSVLFDKIDTPDIKIDVPDGKTGLFNFNYKEVLSPAQFQLSLIDASQKIPITPTGEVRGHIYVQVHSRGFKSANNVHVFLLMKAVSGDGLPDLPKNYKENLQKGMPIEEDEWQTVGIRLAQDVVAGSPKVVQFDLTPNLFSKTLDTIGEKGKAFVLVALLHHPLDPFNSDNRKIADTKKIDPLKEDSLLLSDERKVMIKRIKVVPHDNFKDVVAPLSIPPLQGFVRVPETATLPEAPYDAFLGMSFRANDETLHKMLLSRLAQPISNRGTET